MEALKVQLKLIESRIPAFNVLKLGGKIFNSKTEVAVFVETKLPSNAFYLFHNVVTLMERLSGSYVEHTDVIKEMYQAKQVGIDEREA
jgi:hypothetical protein